MSNTEVVLRRMELYMRIVIVSCIANDPRPTGTDRRLVGRPETMWQMEI
jgi:hypothetical protein